MGQHRRGDMGIAIKPCQCGCQDYVEIVDVTMFASVYACAECGVLRIATASNIQTPNPAPADSPGAGQKE